MSNITNFFKSILACFLGLLLVTSCSNDYEPPTSAKRTILVYMIASNSLGYNGYDESDLQEMESAVSSNSLNGCRLLVFLKNYDNNSTLFEITRTNGVATRTTLKTYDNSVAATSVSRMSSVISDVASLAPAKSYGLILWSHASGWALKFERSNATKAMAANMPIVRNYGQDGTYEMRVNELADALPDNMFDFIYCDVCYFGCVEIAYQLRKKTHYFVASPTVILGDGMPYNQNIPAFCKDTPDLVAACQNTFNYYNAQSGEYKSSTIALVDCSALDALASISAKIFANNKTVGSSGIQQYVLPSDGKCLFFDFLQYMKAMATDEQASELNAAYNKAVIYKAATTSIMQRLTINLDNFSGLSSYIMGIGNETNENYYTTLDWYKDTVNKK